MDLKEYIGNQIRIFRKSAGFTQDELAKRLNTTKQTISRYEKGERKANQDMLFKLCDIFDVSIDDFFPVIPKNVLESTRSLTEAPDSLTQQITDKVVQLTTHNKKIVLRTSEELLEGQQLEVNEELFEYQVFEKLSAGTGETYYEDRNYDTVFFDKEIAHDFASWVYGDSMEPDYLSGSVALIKDTGWDYDGAIYAVDWDGQSYIKKVYKEKDGLRLVSLNNKYADKFAPFSEEPRIIGKVVGNFMPLEI
ncbi:XRE family transcriptional regulator [Streptococcus cristatus]|uniref:Pleiotropic regulator n=1 Tax=Streptococcus cristatus TaxID=45634 RepID=A0A139N1R2_STRCR|nr:XRE family transcriptional regulator [Streptococcus cristatus]KXT69966.1 Pleiotropic regulator [Streptococcus cristatus]QBX13931.1 pleiotropic regulator of exopolysaccharide synthesis, competence and biofilm formation [Streptococcus phage Javan115]